jgi:FkbM family methyltransferase
MLINEVEVNKRFHVSLLKKLSWIFQVRPMFLASVLLKNLVPDERRRIVDTDMGIRLYLDPFTKLGRSIVEHGVFEKETFNIFKSEIQGGQVVLDIGANEGVFSALAGTLVGSQGLVIAVEPQSRLRDLIEINLEINKVENFRIFLSAIGEPEGLEGSLNLYPVFNMGASSIVRKYKFSGDTHVEKFKYISLSSIFEECQVEVIDFVKIDVEGFEHKVVKELLPFIESGRIKKLLLDYHTKILNEQKVNPRDIHNSLIECGVQVKYGDVNHLSSYVLYESVQR